MVSATIQGNQIGTNAAGTAVIANGSGGISLLGGVGTIGGTAAGAGNVIRGNGTRGVNVSGASTRVAILGNQIYGNGTLGIDLNATGVTANDGAKSESQAGIRHSR